MKTLIMKFGGAAFATPQMYSTCARIIQERKQEFSNIVVVVSAMYGLTDQLIQLAYQVSSKPPPRELDMLISTGERISISLLAMALKDCFLDAVSFTGSQTGIITCSSHTNARIVDVRPQRLLPELDSGKVVIVAGFQGVSKEKEITTLGRGGSDTTAVALAIALRAEKVEFYKDVAGIFNLDPKCYPEASLCPKLTYAEAAKIASSGARILHLRCIDLASKNKIPLYVRSFKKDLKNSQVGTWIGNEGVLLENRPAMSYERYNQKLCLT